MRHEFIAKPKMTGVAYDEEFDLLVYSTEDGRIVTSSTRRDSNNYHRVEMKVETKYPQKITSLILLKSHSVLLLGMESGSVMAYLWPICKPVRGKEFDIHLAQVNSFSISSCGKYLATASNDGSVFFNYIREIYKGIDLDTNKSVLDNNEELLKRKRLIQSNRYKVHLHMNGLQLVDNNVMDQKETLLSELIYQTNNNYFQEELQGQASKYTEEINDLNAKNTHDLESEKEKYNSLQSNHSSDKHSLLRMLEEMKENHERNIEELNTDFEKKLRIAYDQHDRLVDQYEKTKSEYQDKLDSIMGDNQDALTKIEKEYKDKYDHLSKNHIRLINDMKRDGEKFDVALEQCE